MTGQSCKVGLQTNRTPLVGDLPLVYRPLEGPSLPVTLSNLTDYPLSFSRVMKPGGGTGR